LIGIETKEYIEDLVNDIIENQTDTIPNLTTQTDVESTVFSVDSVTPLGLIINELITNCIKHAFASGVKNPKITLEFKKHGDGYLLKVSDNGIGFSNEINENSFGIKLIHALAKKLKGKLCSRTTAAPISRWKLLNLNKCLKPMSIKIYIIEDEPLIAETIKTALEKVGYTIIGMTDNGKEALFDIEELQPDLILVDITLDGKMDGIEMVTYLRKNQKCRLFS
jgi:hypothetical protein